MVLQRIAARPHSRIQRILLIPTRCILRLAAIKPSHHKPGLSMVYRVLMIQLSSIQTIQAIRFQIPVITMFVFISQPIQVAPGHIASMLVSTAWAEEQLTGYLHFLIRQQQWLAYALSLTGQKYSGLLYITYPVIPFIKHKGRA